MRILRSYLLRLHLVPFLLGFAVVTFILEMDVLFDYLDLMVNRGVAPLIVLQLFLLSLGFIIALSVPCAVLVAVLMTFGRLSQDNEITALRASGVNLASVLVAPLGASIVLAIAMTYFNNVIYPETNHALANLLIDIHRMRPTVRLQEGQFITDFPGYNLLVHSVNSRTNEMRGVTIYQLNPGGPPTTIIAERGYLYYTPDGRTAVLELRDGEIHEIPPDETGSRRYRRLEFKTHIIHVAGAGGILERTVRRARGDREMGAQALAAERDTVEMQYATSLASRTSRLRTFGAPEEVIALLAPERRPVPQRLAAGFGALFHRAGPVDDLRRSSPEWAAEIEGWYAERTALLKRLAVLSVEIHKKFSVPVACVVFVLLGAPLGMRVRRAGPAVAFVSIAFFLFYYLCLIGGEELADRLIFPAWLAMWLPNIVLGGWGLVATWRAFELPALRLVPGRKHASP